MSFCRSTLFLSTALIFFILCVASCKNESASAPIAEKEIVVNGVGENGSHTVKPASDIAVDQKRGNKLYEIKIDPNSTCYQTVSNVGKSNEDIIQFRYTTEVSRVKGMYNHYTPNGVIRSGVVTGFKSNNTMKLVFSYREGEATKRQGLSVEEFEDHVIITHPEEKNRQVKVARISCSQLKK